MNKCIITGKKIIGDGNNAAPIADARCSDEANMNVVIPYRRFLANDKKDMAMLLKTDNTIELIKPKDKYFSLEELQGYVEGLIEYYPHRIDGNNVICNEEGLLLDLPYNNLAKLILDVDLVGPILVSPANLDEYDED